MLWRLLRVKIVESTGVTYAGRWTDKKCTLRITWNPFTSLALLNIPVNTAAKPSRAGTSCICTSMPFTQSSRHNNTIKTLSSLLGPFQDPSDLLQFVVESFDGPKKYHCGLCNKFGHNGKAHVRNHIEAVHYPNTFLYSCDQCGQSFPSKNNAQLHKSRVHKRGETR